MVERLASYHFPLHAGIIFAGMLCLVRLLEVVNDD